MKKAHRVKMDLGLVGYLAGVFDGEGYFGFYVDKGKSYAQVQIVNTEKELLDPFLVFGGGIYNHSHSGNVNHSKSFVYMLRGRRIVLSFILTLYGWMKSQKKKSKMKRFLIENSHLLTMYDKKKFWIKG